MKINVRVVPRASRIQVKTGNDILKVYLTRPAVDGEANSQLIEVLADHFKVKKYQVEIIQGNNSRNKVIRIEDAPSSLAKR
jgi:uncharacterized protein (TIGR00251 family)